MGVDGQKAHGAFPAAANPRKWPAALERADGRSQPLTDPSIRASGLTLVGVGPGDPNLLTVAAVRAIEAAGGRPITSLKADGGATANGWLMKFQADVLGVPVIVPEISETTALGAAMMAGVGAGLFTESDAAERWRERVRYEPQMAAGERDRLLDEWHRAVERSRNWAGA